MRVCVCAHSERVGITGDGEALESLGAIPTMSGVIELVLEFEEMQVYKGRRVCDLRKCAPKLKTVTLRAVDNRVVEQYIELRVGEDVEVKAAPKMFPLLQYMRGLEVYVTVTGDGSALAALDTVADIAHATRVLLVFRDVEPWEGVRMCDLTECAPNARQVLLIESQRNGMQSRLDVHVRSGVKVVTAGKVDFPFVRVYVGKRQRLRAYTVPGGMSVGGFGVTQMQPTVRADVLEIRVTAGEEHRLEWLVGAQIRQLVLLEGTVNLDILNRVERVQHVQLHDCMVTNGTIQLRGIDSVYCKSTRPEGMRLVMGGPEPPKVIIADGTVELETTANFNGEAVRLEFKGDAVWTARQAGGVRKVIVNQTDGLAMVSGQTMEQLEIRVPPKAKCVAPEDVRGLRVLTYVVSEVDDARTCVVDLGEQAELDKVVMTNAREYALAGAKVEVRVMSKRKPELQISHKLYAKGNVVWRDMSAGRVVRHVVQRGMATDLASVTTPAKRVKHVFVVPEWSQRGTDPLSLNCASETTLEELVLDVESATFRMTRPVSVIVPAKTRVFVTRLAALPQLHIFRVGENTNSYVKDDDTKHHLMEDGAGNELLIQYKTFRQYTDGTAMLEDVVVLETDKPRNLKLLGAYECTRVQIPSGPVKMVDLLCIPMQRLTLGLCVRIEGDATLVAALAPKLFEVTTAVPLRIQPSSQLYRVNVQYGGVMTLVGDGLWNDLRVHMNGGSVSQEGTAVVGALEVYQSKYDMPLIRAKALTVHYVKEIFNAFQMDGTVVESLTYVLYPQWQASSSEAPVNLSHERFPNLKSIVINSGEAGVRQPMYCDLRLWVDADQVCVAYDDETFKNIHVKAFRISEDRKHISSGSTLSATTVPGEVYASKDITDATLHVRHVFDTDSRPPAADAMYTLDYTRFPQLKTVEIELGDDDDDAAMIECRIAVKVAGKTRVKLPDPFAFPNLVVARDGFPEEYLWHRAPCCVYKYKNASVSASGERRLEEVIIEKIIYGNNIAQLFADTYIETMVVIVPELSPTMFDGMQIKKLMINVNRLDCSAWTVNMPILQSLYVDFQNPGAMVHLRPNGALRKLETGAHTNVLLDDVPCAAELTLSILGQSKIFCVDSTAVFRAVHMSNFHSDPMVLRAHEYQVALVRYPCENLVVPPLQHCTYLQYIFAKDTLADQIPRLVLDVLKAEHDCQLHMMCSEGVTVTTPIVIRAPETSVVKLFTSMSTVEFKQKKPERTIRVVQVHTMDDLVVVSGEEEVHYEFCLPPTQRESRNAAPENPAPIVLDYMNEPVLKRIKFICTNGQPLRQPVRVLADDRRVNIVMNNGDNFSFVDLKMTASGEWGWFPMELRVPHAGSFTVYQPGWQVCMYCMEPVSASPHSPVAYRAKGCGVYALTATSKHDIKSLEILDVQKLYLTGGIVDYDELVHTHLRVGALYFHNVTLVTSRKDGVIDLNKLAMMKTPIENGVHYKAHEVEDYPKPPAVMMEWTQREGDALRLVCNGDAVIEIKGESAKPGRFQVIASGNTKLRDVNKALPLDHVQMVCDRLEDLCDAYYTSVIVKEKHRVHPVRVGPQRHIVYRYFREKDNKHKSYKLDFTRFKHLETVEFDVSRSHRVAVVQDKITLQLPEGVQLQYKEEQFPNLKATFYAVC